MAKKVRKLVLCSLESPPADAPGWTLNDKWKGIYMNHTEPGIIILSLHNYFFYFDKGNDGFDNEEETA